MAPAIISEIHRLRSSISFHFTYASIDNPSDTSDFWVLPCEGNHSAKAFERNLVNICSRVRVHVNQERENQISWAIRDHAKEIMQRRRRINVECLPESPIQTLDFSTSRRILAGRWIVNAEFDPWWPFCQNLCTLLFCCDVSTRVCHGTISSAIRAEGKSRPGNRDDYRSSPRLETRRTKLQGMQ
jgi:hypothetical protein